MIFLSVIDCNPNLCFHMIAIFCFHFWEKKQFGVSERGGCRDIDDSVLTGICI